MAEMAEVEQDPVLEAIANLSDVAATTADDLVALNDNLDRIRQRRQQGSSWRHIISANDVRNPSSLLTKVAADLALACGAFRRALAIGLRREGLRVTEIASLFDVSRQRVSALIRSQGAGGSDDSMTADDASPPTP
jgi:hypothetical protein